MRRSGQVGDNIDMGRQPRTADGSSTGYGEALIAACRRGDPRALEEVFRQELPRVERLVARMVGPSADLEDLVQTTLTEAVAAFPRFRGDASVRTWLARIAVCTVRDRWRKTARRKEHALRLVHDEATRDTPADLSVRHRRLEALYGHLQKLRRDHAIAFVLHFFEGRTIDEIAALTSVSSSAARSRVFRGRKAILKRAAQDPLLAELVSEGTQ